MTNLTSSEIKIVYFALFFVAILGAWMAIYYENPIPSSQAYGGATNATNSTSVSSDTWITGLITSLPSPFNSTITLIVGSIIILPVGIMLGYIAIRAIKDLATQWL